MEFTFWTVIGIMAAALTSFSFVPQVRKMWRRKSARDVSNITIIQLMLGCALWLVYGVSLKDPVIIGGNFIAVTILIIGLVLYYHYQEKGK